MLNETYTTVIAVIGYYLTGIVVNYLTTVFLFNIRMDDIQAGLLIFVLSIFWPVYVLGGLCYLLVRRINSVLGILKVPTKYGDGVRWANGDELKAKYAAYLAKKQQANLVKNVKEKYG